MLENLNGKILDLMNDKGKIAPTSASSLVNLLKPENKIHFRIKKTLIWLGWKIFWKMGEYWLVYMITC